MTTQPNTPSMAMPLWDAKRVASSFARITKEDGTVGAEEIMLVIMGIIGEYEAALAAKDARIERLEAQLNEAKQRAFVGESWSDTVDYLLAHAPEPEPPVPEPPDDWDEDNDDDKPHYDTPGGW